MTQLACQHTQPAAQPPQLQQQPAHSETVAAVSNHRFYNADLEDVYRSCPLPVKRREPNDPVHRLQPSQYRHYLDEGSGIVSWESYPRDEEGVLGPRPDLSKPFAPPLPNDYQSDAEAEPEEPKKKKRRRKRELRGELRCYRVRMIPTPSQKRELKRCFGAARHAYNWFVNQVEEHGEAPNEYALRNAHRALHDRPGWTAPVATRIVAGGINDAANAYKSNFAMRKKDPGHHFKVRYRSHRRTLTESMHIEGDGDGVGKCSPIIAIKPSPYVNSSTKREECMVFFGNNLSGVGPETMREAESSVDRAHRLALNAQLRAIGEKSLPKPKAGAWRNKGLDGIRLQDKPHVVAKLLAEGRSGNGDGVINGCKIHWDKRKDTFHLLYMYELPQAAPDPDPRFETKRIVATDAGVRTFQTWYSPTSGAHGELFLDGQYELERRCARIDALHSSVDRLRAEHLHPPPGRTRTPRQRGRRLKRMKRQTAREQCRLRDWMKAGHYACAHALLRAHDLVIAPHLKVASMVPRDGRVFGSKVARAMLTWSHGLFEQRLHSAAYRYSGRTVLTDAYEPGTSRTCPECGHWHADLGASKVFDCPKCGVSIHRDVNGARNNFFAFYGRASALGWDGTH